MCARNTRLNIQASTFRCNVFIISDTTIMYFKYIAIFEFYNEKDRRILIVIRECHFSNILNLRLDSKKNIQSNIEQKLTEHKVKLLPRNDFGIEMS